MQQEKSTTKRREDGPANSWYDGEKWIPVTEMTEEHLRRAKLFAQRKEEEFFNKANKFGEKVDMLEQEAQRRGIKIRDYRSSFQKSQRTLKKATAKLTDQTKK